MQKLKLKILTKNHESRIQRIHQISFELGKVLSCYSIVPRIHLLIKIKIIFISLSPIFEKRDQSVSDWSRSTLSS
jgi:hypothetical protein